MVDQLLNWGAVLYDSLVSALEPAIAALLNPHLVFPPARRDAVVRALAATFPGGELTQATALTGGLSRGGIYKLAISGTDYVMRLDAPREGFRDPARQYACLTIASNAGVAPHVHHADADERIAITDFIPQTSWKVPQDRYLESVAKAVRSLHAAPLFPRVMPYFHVMEILIGMLKAANILPENAIADHLRLYRALVAAYPKDAELVSSHNDLNPNNVLFAGERPFFVDWETAFAADRYVDLATLGTFATDDAGEEIVLRSYFGEALDDTKRARFALMLQVMRLFYGIALLNIAAQPQSGTRLTLDMFRDAPSFRAIRSEMNLLTTLPGQIRFGCAFFGDALRGMQSPRCQEAMGLLKAQ